MTLRINFTVLNSNLYSLTNGRKCDCSFSLYFIHPCNDIFLWIYVLYHL